MAAITLAILLARTGRSAEAFSLMQQARQAISQFRSPVMQLFVDAAHTCVLLAVKRFDDAVAWAEAFQQTPEPEFRRTFEQLTLARVFLANRQPQDALAVLDTVLAQAQADGRVGHIIEAEALRALAYAALSRTDSALCSLRRALAPAAQEGYVRTFLDEGTPMLRLLRDAVDREIEGEYAAHLLQTAEVDRHAAHPSDLLSAREIEVLALLAAGATNQDVAAQLVVSLGTVKSHINHLMNKLDARNRTEAVAKARSLGIVKN
jgi:LuxR family maltose regulon positive regulatory protein